MQPVGKQTAFEKGMKKLAVSGFPEYHGDRVRIISKSLRRMTVSLEPKLQVKVRTTVVDPKVRSETGPRTNSKHWFTTSFLQPLPYLVTP